MSPLRESVSEFLKSQGLRLNTDLGQHFLVDEDILETIINAAGIEEDDYIVEIGPGIGVLTKELLENTHRVTAIELDERLIPLLKRYCSLNQKRKTKNELTIIQGNALLVPLPSEPYKIVANIPYHITSPLLRHAFLESTVRPTSMTLLIQREVAEKICDKDDAGILTILVGLFGEPEIVCRVPPKSFLPPPKVDSAVLHVKCFTEPKANRQDIEEIFKLTRIAFGQKRKMLRNTLGQFLPLAERLSALGIEQNRRPQTLSLEEWIALAKLR